MAKEKNERQDSPRDELEKKVQKMMDPRLPGDPEEAVPETITEDDASPSAPELPDRELSIDEHGDKPADVAEKLNESIAGLSSEDENPGSIDGDTLPPTNESELAELSVLEDPDTDKAVEDIVAKEGDELLEVEDAVRDTDVDDESASQTRRGIGDILKAWWVKPRVRKAVIIGGLIVLLLLAIVPGSRYFVLNTAGVRASSSLVVMDDSTRQPLKNVQVTIGNTRSVTGVDGRVSLKKIRLGANKLTIDRRAFAPITKTITLGWGSNPLGDFKLTPTGTQYGFTVTDLLSGKAISKVEASHNDVNALSDTKGLIKLTIDKPSDDKLAVTIKAEGYRAEQLNIDPNDKTSHSVKLVPARKHVFVSKRSGKYDVYSVYADGKDEKLALAGSGSEREDMVIVPHPAKDLTAYVSTRGNQHNSDGFLLSNLILIDTASGTTTNIAASERIQIINWSVDNLIYVATAAGTSGNSPKRNRLVSYNIKDATSTELASSNYFNDVVFAAGAVYYAPSSVVQTSPAGFHRVNPTGGGNETIAQLEVWNILRTAYDRFTLASGQQWYDFRLSDKTPTKLSTAPANQTSRTYADSPDGRLSVWIDNRDGKGVLIGYDITTKKDTVLRSQSGLVYPVRWLSDNAVVYRVKTDQETADYALSTAGGQPVKIRDVTNTSGLNGVSYH